MGIPIIGGIVSGVVDHAAEALLGQSSPASSLVKGALKVGGALVTGDVFTGLAGAKDLMTGAVGSAPAAVEFMGSIGGSFGIGGLAFGPIGICAQVAVNKLVQGYAPRPPVFDAQLASAVGLLKRDFDLLDTAAGIGAKDGVIGTVDLLAAMGNPALPATLREACRFLAFNPSARHQVDVAAGVGSVDGRITRADLDAMERRLDALNPCPFPLPAKPTPPAGPTCPPVPTCPTTPNPPPVPGTPVPGTPRPSGWDIQFDSALACLDRYFDFLDTASGINGKDGQIGRCDLEAALRNPSLPPQLAEACSFLLRNPAAWNQVDVGAGIGQVDGLIIRADIETVRRRRTPAPLPMPAPAQPTPGASTSGSSGTGKTSSNSKTPSTSTGSKTPSTSSGKTSSDSKTSTSAKTASSKSSKLSGMSAEQIVDSMLLELLNGLDSQLIDKAKDLEKAEAAKTKAKSGSSDEKTATADYNRIYADIQKIAERRKQMYDLVSNLSKLGHDMARTAIGNIGR